MRTFLNGGARGRGAAGLFTDAEYRDLHAYYAAHPERASTPLRRLRALAVSAGLGALDVKDESGRHGTEAFKILGVRYAVHRLGDDAARRGLVCATAGNHGRAVARVAHEKRVPCTVFVPAARADAHPAELRVRASRVAAMRADGADVIDVDGTYEEAVRRAAAHASASGSTVVSDTGWPGYQQIPHWIMLGYTQLFEEAFTQWDTVPDAILVQGGVGGLVCAAVSWAAWRFGDDRPMIVSCEPERAACLLASAEAGRPVTLEGRLDTIMAGLRCGEPSHAAWPAIQDGVDLFLTVDDDAVVRTMARLGAPAEEDEAIASGPSGACSVAAALSLSASDAWPALQARARRPESIRVLAVVTEGA